MINVVVGKGTATFNQFQQLDWNGEEKWLMVEVDFDNGTNFEDLDYLPLRLLVLAHRPSLWWEIPLFCPVGRAFPCNY